VFDVYIRRAIEADQPIFPSKFKLAGADDDENGVKSLAQLRISKGDYEYSCQYLNDPIDESTVEFKRHWIRSFVWNDDLVSKLQRATTTLSVDPAFRLKETNDFSGLVLTKVTPDNSVYVLEATQKKLNAKQLVEEIFTLVTTYEPQRVLVETVSAQILLVELLRDEMKRRNTYFLIEEVKPNTKETKAMRIRGLVPHYANARILHRPGLHDLETQLLEFPRGIHDDIIDALAYQVPYWVAGTAPTPVKSTEGTFKWWVKHYTPKSNNPTANLFKGLIRPRRRW